MNGSSQRQTQSAVSQPWAPAQPYLRDILSQASTLGGNTSLFNPVQGAATQAALGQMADYGTGQTATSQAASPIIGGAGQGYGAGLNTLMQTASGANLDPTRNPAFMDALRAANQRTTEQVNSQFSGLGRYGSGANTLSLARALNETNTGALTNQYNTNLQNQQAAANTLLQGGYAGINAGQAVDSARQGQNQSLLQSGLLGDQYQLGLQQAPLNALQWQSGLTNPIAGLGGQTSGTSTSQNNPSMGSMIGGGLLTALAFL